jgi:hypothetical protein
MTVAAVAPARTWTESEEAVVKYRSRPTMTGFEETVYSPGETESSVLDVRWRA